MNSKNPLRLDVITTAATPPSGTVNIYVKSDGLYTKDSAGTEAKAGGGASSLAAGSSTFNSTTGRAISHAIGNTNYIVIPSPTANPSYLLGEIWVTKATNSFTVYNSGTATTAFDYIVFPIA